MYLFDFQSKLKQLNPNLYVNTDITRHIEGDWRSTGIYLRNAGGRKGRSAGLGNVSVEAQKLLRDTMAGNVDKYVSPCPVGFVPEYNVYKFDEYGEGTILAIGWRAILCHLMRSGLIEPRKTKKIFACYGLGESSYDRSSNSAKMQRAKENA